MESNYTITEINTNSCIGENELIDRRSPNVCYMINCDHPINIWKIKPKIGDKIKYIKHDELPYRVISIYVNGELAFP